MDDCTIDQGTIIYGIRSEKYPTVPCYGVIITARCDIAQKKVPKYYYLVAVDASDWFCTEYGYELVYKNTISNLKKEIDSKASEVELNGSVLVALEDDELETVISAKRIEYTGDKNRLKKIESLYGKIIECRVFAGKSMNAQSRSEAINKKPKPATDELERIDKGNNNHFYYLPQDAYLGNAIYNKGIIVDLLEIGEISLNDAENIRTPGIDYQVLPKIPTPDEMIEIISSERHQSIEEMYDRIREHARLSKAYWLKDDSDYVVIEETIKSPWCEHLMQRFSNAFIRIGIKNPTQQDYKDVVSKCYTGSVTIE